jgi:hypothetical protein
LRFFTRTTLEETLAKSGWGVTWRGEVGKDLYEAEFHTRLETWPPALRDFVCNHPNRRAYQLLCECVPQVRIKSLPPSVDVATLSAPQFAARMLWAQTAAEVNYERGATAFGRIGDSAQVLTWKLPEAAPYVRIRLSDRPGFMRITGISLTDPAGNRRAFSIAECTLSEDVAHANDALLLSSAEAWLALPPGNYPAGCTLEVHCGWPMSGDFVAAGETFKALCEAHQKHLETLTFDVKSVQEKANTFEKNMLEREALIAERDAQIARRNEHAGHLEKLVSEREAIIIERDRQLELTNTRAERAEAVANELRIQSENTIAQLQEQLRARDDHIAHLKTARGWVRSKLKS